MISEKEPRLVGEKDILGFIKENQPCTWTRIMDYATKGCKEDGLETLGITAAVTLLKRLVSEKKVKRKEKDYSIPKKPQTRSTKTRQTRSTKPRAQPVKKPSRAVKHTPQLNVQTDFSDTMPPETSHDAFYLLRRTMILLAILPKPHRENSNHRIKKIHSALIKVGISKEHQRFSELNDLPDKVLNEVLGRYLGRPVDIDALIPPLWEKPTLSSAELKRVSDACNVPSSDADFLDIFSDLIITTRNDMLQCYDVASTEMRHKELSCALKDGITVLNDASRNLSDEMMDVRPQLNKYWHDKQENILAVTVSGIDHIESKYLAVFWDKNEQYFGTSKELLGEENDHLYLRLSRADTEGEHVLSVQVRCSEFSFRINNENKNLDIKHLDFYPVKLVTLDHIPKTSGRNYVLVSDMGGQIGKLIESWSSKKVRCFRCNKTFDSHHWIGYEHTNGLEAKTGKKYWPNWACQECGFESSPHNLHVIRSATAKRNAKQNGRSRRSGVKSTKKMKKSHSSKAILHDDI